MSRLALKAVLSLATISSISVALAAHRAEAVEGDCRSNPGICDFQETKTVLRTAIWANADCTPSRWNALSHAGFPFDGDKIALGTRAPVHFLGGVCQLHATNGNADEGIGELQKAQTIGLLPAQKSVASLFQGILHCRKL